MDFVTCAFQSKKCSKKTTKVIRPSSLGVALAVDKITARYVVGQPPSVSGGDSGQDRVVGRRRPPSSETASLARVVSLPTVDR
jgi:hypothetical protein